MPRQAGSKTEALSSVLFADELGSVGVDDSSNWV